MTNNQNQKRTANIVLFVAIAAILTLLVFAAMKTPAKVTGSNPVTPAPFYQRNLAPIQSYYQPHHKFTYNSRIRQR